MNDRTARQKILDAAATLFYNDGITATGINTVTAKADVAKMSLYNNFSSKGELVDAYIAARHQEWLDLYQKRLEKQKQRKKLFWPYLMPIKIMPSLLMKRVLEDVGY